MNNETIKDQVRRLIAGIAPCYEKRPDLIKDDDYCFGFMLEVVELAIAEEREANGWISVKDRLPEWASRDDTPCEIDGKKVGALLTSEKVLVVIAPRDTVRIDHLTAIECSDGERQHKWFNTYRDRVRYWSPLPAAPKAEVSE